jgi:hypothetical protein
MSVSKEIELDNAKYFCFVSRYKTSGMQFSFIKDLLIAEQQNSFDGIYRLIKDSFLVGKNVCILGISKIEVLKI